MEYKQQRPTRSHVDRAGIHSLCLLFPSAVDPLLNVVSHESSLFAYREGLEIGKRIIFPDTLGLCDRFQSFRFRPPSRAGHYNALSGQVLFEKIRSPILPRVPESLLSGNYRFRYTTLTPNFVLLLSWCYRGLTQRHTDQNQGQPCKVNWLFHSCSLQDRTFLLASESTGDLVALPTFWTAFRPKHLFQNGIRSFL